MSDPFDPSKNASGLARVLGPGFEPRPQQVEMASAVARALESRSTLLVEAGTGVGKSFAYLIPAIGRIIASGGAERVVVATNTIALQEQLLRKDIPLMRRLFAPAGAADAEGDDGPFRAELVKGRGNYLSLRRLELASSRQESLFLDEPSRRSLHVIEDWAYATSDGTLSTRPAIERAGIWDRVQSDSGNCMGRKCNNYEKCFYQSARRRMERANLLICNHALFFADLALHVAGEGARGFLPEYHHVILDEAHSVEETAAEHFGRTLSEARVRHLLGALWQPRRAKGYLATVRGTGEVEAVRARAAALAESASDASDEFFESLLRSTGGQVAAVRTPYRGPGGDPLVPNIITPVFRELALALKRLKDALVVEEDKYELNSYALRAASIADDAEVLLEQRFEGYAYWVEAQAPEEGTGFRGGRVRVQIAASPVDVAPVLRRVLFDGSRSVVLTSATLTTSQQSQREPHEDEDAPARRPDPRGPFSHAISRLGCDDAEVLMLGSPFDHSSNVELYADASMPDPRSARYAEELASRILRHVEATDGGAFVLFTSFRVMHDVARRMRPILASRGHPLWVHGLDGSRTHILERFREDDRSVLLGTSSFWQGVDVPGRTLRNVVITRLPFDPPDRPLTQARLEMIEARGGNPFMDDSLPRAVIRFKQGFGRLVRTATDAGRVVVLDPRILTARYGRLFLDALPEGVRVRREG